MEEKDYVERENRKCPVCHRRIIGRSDKIFCCDGCRSLFNNRKRREDLRAARKIDRILKKNRSIIADLYSHGHTRVDFSVMHSRGFDFSYITSIRDTDDPHLPYILSCFEYDYSILEDGTVCLYKN